MNFSPDIANLLIIIASMLIVLAGGIVAGWMARNKDLATPFPINLELEELILPYVYEAVIAAYKTSERAVDELQERMKGIDKALVAQIVYDMLPPKIGVYDITFIKQYITLAQFQAMIDFILETVDEVIEKNQGKFDEAFNKWKLENELASK